MAEEVRPLDIRALSLKTDLRIQELEPSKEKKELVEPRTKAPSDIDKCVKGLEGKNTFGERIAYFVDRHISPREIYFVDQNKEPLDYVDSFHLVSNPSKVGLATHPLCEMTEYRFLQTINREGRDLRSSEQKSAEAAKDQAAAQSIIEQYAKLQAAAKAGGEDEYNAFAEFIAANKSAIGRGVFSFLAKKSAASGSLAEVTAASTYEKLYSKSHNSKAKAEDRKKAASDLKKYLLEQSILQLATAFNLANFNIPDKETLKKVNRFAQEHNQYRKEMADTDPKISSRGRQRLGALWTNLMQCISYAESLMDPDSQRAIDLAGTTGKGDEEKPRKLKNDGIEWYMDQSQGGGPRQLAVGLFQFTAHSVANQFPCVNAWNAVYQSCPIDPFKALKDGTKKWDREKMLDIIASPLQTYNANCGINKILQSFYIQVNTTEARRSNYANLRDREELNGPLKAPADRCVTPHFHSTLTFNHFGPLQNSTGNNLGIVMNCVY